MAIDPNYPSAPSPYVVAAQDRADLREAYERGRSDERDSRKRHPLMMSLTIIAAIAGVVVLVLAAVNGSFGRAGGVVDQNIAVAADKAAPVVKDAAAKTSQSMRDAGQTVRDKVG